MQQQMNGEKQPLHADRLFHLRIAEATGNGALVQVVKMLWEERTGPLYKQLEHHYDSPQLWIAAMAEHRAVLKPIAAHDPAAARTAMQRHLNQAYKRFSTGWDALH
jgi:GntR family transcriptional repressor for pyruvate dehydrogenase complex